MSTPVVRSRCLVSLCLGGLCCLASPLPAQSSSESTQAAEETLRIQRLEESERTRMRNEEMQRTAHDAWIGSAAERQSALVFLPPLPPALADAGSALPALPYPLVLAEYAGESFFMTLGSVKLRGLLRPAQLERVARYCENRDQLTAALRARLAAAALLPPGQRAPALGEFTARQASALRKLEDSAESIRAELALVDDGAALLRQRDAQAAHRQDYWSAIHAAHFIEGLSLEQRQLLHEIALEALLQAGAPAGPAHSFFLPAAARVRWPESLAGSISGRLQKLQSLRQELKAGLMQAVVRDSGQIADARRRKAYAALAARQAAQFEESHRLAEEIRAALAGVAYPDQPEASGFPPELVRLVGSAAAGKVAFESGLARRYRRFNDAFAPERLKLANHAGQPVIELLPATEPSLKTPDERAALLNQLREYNEELSRDFPLLAQALESARIATQRFRESLGADAPTTGKLAAQLAKTHAREEAWRKFGDYHAAVLQPGLSPAQRRLLFNAALRDLEKHRLATSN